MSDVTYVGIAEYKLKRGAGTLACSALGSCVAVCLWDGRLKLGGMLHILLPASGDAAVTGYPLKYADTGVELMVAEMERRGASRARLTAKLAGGGCLFHYERGAGVMEIGARNVIAAREALFQQKIPIAAEHVGGEYGRSVRFEVSNFEVRVAVLSQGATVI